MPNPFCNNTKINTSIRMHLEKELDKYNNIKFAYAIMNKNDPADFTVISNKTEWFSFYTKNNYQVIDPVLMTASSRITPFSWHESIAMNKDTKKNMIFQMAKYYNILDGYTFLLHDHCDNLAVLSIIMDKYCDSSMENTITDHKNDIQMLLLTTHDKFINFYHEEYNEDSINIPQSKTALSNRENEILYWASIGKSYQEIAIILAIKLTTVKYHMGNAVKKLGVNNAKHAIRRGVELKLIRPITPSHNSYPLNNSSDKRASSE
ncbi:LuxR family transcriptional regulator [Candidatus Symbiopectobacterium sp. NZEC127]|uniref:helix-turn-helix transcriptional regulator n=1 Tax=Candidatus Symbiopectobacterium sp. NZEC127 TaxID=2820472 RepID=UPI0022267D85|nr:LuxR family transcriptional regulator [Candidatus Symbiopectobacterium sp. NZEC127]MCW2487131.1 LuxR family transcriptional regulator [Candidatus Symbiopectobacterium sp. NZEC127]